MVLVQVFLPLYDNSKRPLPQHLFQQVRRELSEKFGGLTAFTRAPVEGLWNDGRGHAEPTRDDLVILEVMADKIDRGWWMTYRQQLETRFRQEIILIRAQRIEIL